VALVEYLEPSHARAAFKGLAYRRYHHIPIYLEWAPLSTPLAKADTEEGRHKEASPASSPALKASGEGTQSAAEGAEGYRTLFVKNLSFGTNEAMLRDHLQRLGLIGSVRSISLPKKLKGGALLSQGFGFIEFQTSGEAARALGRLQGTALDGRSLDLKPSDKHIAAPSTSEVNDLQQLATKLLVRNVAFQATQKELRDLFSTFGSVKRVRIPKKTTGEHRGFAFIDFGTHQEARAAKQALASTHLYGRHLVIEWAEEEDTSVDALRKRSQVDETAIRSAQAKRQRSSQMDESAGDVMDM
jgi:multiple RNA-binding domain-containing protein 1